MPVLWMFCIILVLYIEKRFVDFEFCLSALNECSHYENMPIQCTDFSVKIENFKLKIFNSPES